MKIYFENPSFNDGENITIRRGIKWSTETFAELADMNGHTLVSSAPLSCKVMRFCDLTDRDVEKEHDEKCRTVAGLLEVMKHIYPTFDEREIVTVVSFIY